MKKKEKKGEPHYVTDKNGNKHTYEKTYCCNPFVFASYAHGANDPKCLAACKKGSSGGLYPDNWTRYGVFKGVGHPNYNDLQVGDILLRLGKHAAIYVGNGEYAEATGTRWGADSIRVKPLTKKKYNGFQAVVRYTGNGKGGTTLSTSGGRITSSSGSGVQGALNWATQIANDDSYYYKCVSPCHLCHSNVPKNYCCASFVRSAYAHGAGDSYMMSQCEKSGAGSVSSLVKR